MDRVDENESEKEILIIGEIDEKKSRWGESELRHR